MPEAGEAITLLPGPVLWAGQGHGQTCCLLRGRRRKEEKNKHYGQEPITLLWQHGSPPYSDRPGLGPASMPAQMRRRREHCPAFPAFPLDCGQTWAGTVACGGCRLSLPRLETAVACAAKTCQGQCLQACQLLPAPNPSLACPMLLWRQVGGLLFWDRPGQGQHEAIMPFWEL